MKARVVTVSEMRAEISRSRTGKFDGEIQMAARGETVGLEMEEGEKSERIHGAISRRVRALGLGGVVRIRSTDKMVFIHPVGVASEEMPDGLSLKPSGDSGLVQMDNGCPSQKALELPAMVESVPFSMAGGTDGE